MKKIAVALLAIALTTSMAQAQIVSSKNSRITVEKQKKTRNVNIENYNRLSFGLSTLKLSDTYYDKSDREIFDFDKEPITLKGIDVNYMRGISLTQKFPLFLEVGGRLTYDTYKEDGNDEESYGGNRWEWEWKQRLNILSLSLPVNVTYKYTFSNGFYVAPFAGIHFRLNLLANMSGKEEEYEYRYDDLVDYEKDDDTWSLFKTGDEEWFDDDEDTCKRFQFGGQVGVNLGYKAWNLGFAYYFDTPFYKYESKSNSKYDFKYKTGGVALTIGYNF